MSHLDTPHGEEKKSVNFLAPLIGGLIIWILVLMIETNLDEHHEAKETQHPSEQTHAGH